MRESLCRLAWLAGALAVALTVNPGVCAALPEQGQNPPQGQTPPPPQQPPKPPAAPEETTAPRAATPEKAAPAKTGTGAEPNQFFVEFKYALNGTNLAGNKERSFLNEGINHISDFSSYLKQNWGIRRVESIAVLRYTDDPRVDPERNSLQRAFLRLDGPSFEARFGDNLVNYSRFAFNQNIKGANLRKDLPKDWPLVGGARLTGTAGVFSDRWGSIFRDFRHFADPRRVPDPRFPTKPYTRLVLGARGEQKVSEAVTFGLSYSQGSDIIRSLPPETQVAPVNNQVFGLDTTFFFGQNFRFAGEIVYSLTQFDARIQREKRKDYALRGELSHRWRRLSWRAEYALFMPNFFSANARQVQDLQDGSLRMTVDLSKQVAFQAGYRRTNDNLPQRPVIAFTPDPLTGVLIPKALTNPNRTLERPGILLVFDHVVDATGNKLTTVVELPEARLTFRQLPHLARLQLDVGFRERHVETSNKGSFDPPTGRPLFIERVTRMPFVDISVPTRSGVFTVGYEYRRNRDRVQRANSTFTHRVAASYNGTWYLGKWTVSPRVRYEAERSSKQLNFDPVDNPTTRNRLLDPNTGQPLVATLSGGDLTRSLQSSLEVEFPRYFRLELFYRELSAKILSGFLSGLFFPVPSGGFSEILYGNGGYRRPQFRAQLTYYIRNNQNRFISFIVERTVNSFSLPDVRQPDEKSFRENVAQISFVWRFRRE